MINSVPKSNVYKLIGELEKLNRKAIKLGLTPVSFVITGEDEDTFTIETNEVEPIQIKGWELVAIIENIEGENLIKSVPGAGDIPTKYRTADYECDHCHTKRQRSNLFILRNGEEYKQVGRTCLKDFFATDPQDMLEAAKLYTKFYDALNDKEPYEGREKFSVSYSTHQVVTYACAISRNYGYVSKRSAMEYGKDSTASTVDWLLTIHTYANEALAAAQYLKSLGINNEDKEKANKIIAWAKEISKEAKSDYMYNLGVAFRCEYTTSASFGFVVSAVEAYRKEFEKVEPKEAKVEKISQWVGTVGEKISTEAEVVRVYRSSNNWGDTTMILLEEKDTGNILTWWASGYKVPVMNKVFTITGTVKEHKTFAEKQQTLLTRVKGIEYQESVESY